MKNKTPSQGVITGIIIGFIGTSLGTVLWILFFSNTDIPTTLKNAWEQGLLGAILSAGSLINLGSLFLFLKQKKHYEARGVIIATLIVAFFIIYQKLS